MGEPTRIFTLEEANELVPALELEFGGVARLRDELRSLVEALGGADASVDVLQHGAAPPRGLEAEARRLRIVADEIAAAVERVTAMGCLVKDLDLGLVDFYAMMGNEPVLLCWQFGERQVAHWHKVEEGFSGRKPIQGVEAERPEFMN
ncbi:MAG TPA: DUF2203 domain-containing protein [Anaeromyxobacteraceae bacterium]|jgi:hypothetical protein|nr:DUF2203 domain-containing protein [Anaeromyxobacteraceae bacterium]